MRFVWQSTTLVHVAGASKSLQQRDYYLCEGKFWMVSFRNMICIVQVYIDKEKKEQFYGKQLPSEYRT